MRDGVDEVFSACRKIAVRVSIQVLIVLSLMFSMAAMAAADPEASAEVAEVMRLVSLGPVDITVLDPFIVVLAVWSIAPIRPLVGELVDEIRGIEG